MTGPLALGGPFVAAAVGVTLRRRVGAWASWLVLLLAGYLQIRCCASPPWWTQPDFLAGLDEAVGLLAATLVMALAVHQFGPGWPPWPVHVAATALLGLLVEWANATFHPSTRQLTAFLVVCAVWLVALLARDWHRWRMSAHRAPPNQA